MARAMKWMPERSGWTLVLGERRPCAVRRLGRRVALGAEQQAGLLERLADRGERQRARLGGVRPLDAAHQLRLGARIERRANRHQPVARIDRAAGEHEPAGQEHVAVVAAAHQHLR